MSLAGYDSWLTHNPADDGDWKDIDIDAKCAFEHEDGWSCDFDDTIEVEAWVINNNATFEWQCPKCGMLNEGHKDDVFGYDDDDRDY